MLKPVFLWFNLLFLLFGSLSLQAGELDGIKLHWKAPVYYSNGERLHNAAEELSEYRIYYGASRELVRSGFVPVSPRRLSFPLQQLDTSAIDSPIVYLAITAVSKSGQESDLSDIVFFLP